MTGSGATIEAVWSRIEAHAGETFRQIRGAEFSYDVRSGAIWPDRTNRALSRSDVQCALDHVSLSSTVPLQRLQGPSYLYAILMDARIRRDDW